jgi:hypothetical protein
MTSLAGALADEVDPISNDDFRAMRSLSYSSRSVFSASGRKIAKPETRIPALLWLAGVRHGDYTAM